MRKSNSIFAIVGLLAVTVTVANNPLKIGAAATQLLINPYARTNGMGGFNTAFVSGAESQFANVGGIARINSSSVALSRSNLFGNGVIGVFGASFAQRVGSTGTIGLGVVSINPGDINVTTYNIPEALNGTYKPSFLNINVSYAKVFSDNLVGGFNVKLINEQLPNLGARGIALDAGFQYTAGKKDEFHFGVSLKNIGPKLRYTGEGLTFQVLDPNSANTASQVTVNRRSEQYELPTLFSFGVAYDIYFRKDSAHMNDHKLVPFLGFNSNAYYADEFGVGLEYTFMRILSLRGSYGLNNGNFTNNVYTTNTGLALGASVNWPFNKGKGAVGADYAFQQSKVLPSTHTFGVHLDF
jgi:hypothetical protein